MKRYLLFLVVFCLALVSCNQETNFYLTPDQRNLVCGPDGGTFDDLIFTNGSWTCTVSDDAVTVTPMSGDYTQPVHVVVGQNSEMYTKSIRIHFTSTSGDLSRVANVVVTQDCYPFIFCDEDVKTVGPEGGQVRFTVNSNEAWAIAQPRAITFFRVTPHEGGPNSTTVTFDIPANDEGHERTFEATLQLQEHPSVSETLTVVQKY